MNVELTAGVRNAPTSTVGHWEGVLRDAKRNIVWACGHLHKARDIDMRGARVSARTCACDELKRRAASS
jgi:hypothetical protein